MMTKASILVFGATGQIGGALIRELLPDQKDGSLRVIGATSDAERARHIERLGIEASILDLDRPELDGLETLTEKLRGIDRIFLLTGYDVKMLAQSKAVIDSAKDAGVKHLVHLGAHAAPDTTVVHLGWHQLIEAYLAQSGLGFVNLHPTSLMQNLPMLFTTGGGVPGILPHYIGAARSSWIDARDIAAVAAVVLRDPAAHDGRSYGLGTEAVTMEQIAKMLSEITGVPWTDDPRDPDLFYRIMTAAGADPAYMACVTNIFRRVGAGTLPDLEATFDTVSQLTGRAPTSLRSYLADHQAAFRSVSTKASAR